MAAKYALCIVAAVAAALRRAALRIDVAISDAAALLCAAAALLLLQSCNFYDISFACGASRQKEIKHNSAAWQGQTEGGEGAGDAAELGCCCHNWGRQWHGKGEGVARPFGLQNVNNMALTADIAGLKASCWAALGHAGTKARWGRGQWQVASGKWRLLCCLFAFSAAF